MRPNGFIMVNSRVCVLDILIDMFTCKHKKSILILKSLFHSLCVPGLIHNVYARVSTIVG